MAWAEIQDGFVVGISEKDVEVLLCFTACTVWCFVLMVVCFKVWSYGVVLYWLGSGVVSVVIQGGAVPVLLF